MVRPGTQAVTVLMHPAPGRGSVRPAALRDPRLRPDLCHGGAEHGDRFGERAQFQGPVVAVEQADRAHVEVGGTGGCLAVAARPLFVVFAQRRRNNIRGRPVNEREKPGRCLVVRPVPFSLSHRPWTEEHNLRTIAPPDAHAKAIRPFGSRCTAGAEGNAFMISQFPLATRSAGEVAVCSGGGYLSATSLLV